MPDSVMSKPSTLLMRLGLGRLPIAFAFALALTWAHRVAITLIYLSNNNGFLWHFQRSEGFSPLEKLLSVYGQSLLLGLKTDAIFALVVAVFIVLFGRLGFFLGGVALAGFYAANSEHIRYNESNIDLSMIGLAADPTFISGQATSTLFISFAGFLALGGLLLWFARRRKSKIAINIATGVLALVVVALPVSARFDQPVWMQTHPMMPQIGVPEMAVDDRVFSDTPFTQAPLPFAPVGGKYNVLLVFLEGLSEYSLTLSDMTNIQELAATNIHFRQYIGHQLLTANGIYSTHTARLPHFTNVPMRWYDLQDDSPETPTALPHILRKAGYRTEFLQSAPLRFMRKDEILPVIGYDVIGGSEKMPNPHRRNGWGVDDVTLFETALKHIDQAETGTPWLMTLLTTGTHTPYNVPADFLPDSDSNRYRASRYADMAIGVLVGGLRDRGLLENTVVIITSDESREYSPGTQLDTEVRRSWLPFIMLHPNGMQAQIDEPFAMVDVRDMILAATGDLNRDTIDSIVQRRDTIIFGNVRLGQLFHYKKSEQQLFACNTDRFVCYSHRNVTDLRDLKDVETTGIARFPQLERLIRAREGEEVDCPKDIAICE